MIEVRIRKRFPSASESASFQLDVAFEATSGVTVLFGPSGAGKTLTLEAIAGFVRPDEGRILLDNEILFDGSAGVHLTPQRRHCGYVFQNYALFPHMTLRQNLEFAAERRPRIERHRRVNEMLDAFRLTEVAGRRPHELSGGQKQRCSIARALIGAPKILLLDEPARGLDAPLRAELYTVLRQVRADFSTPVLMVTHDLEECFELGDQMLVIAAGQVVQSGTPRAVLDRPANVDVARLFGQFNLLQAEILALDPSRNTSRLMAGGTELAGPYLRGHLIGDRVWICMRPGELRAAPRLGAPSANEMAATLRRALDLPTGTRLEFDNGLAVETTAAVLDRSPDWVIGFPAAAIRVI